MRYGASPRSLLEWLALRLDKVPLPVLDTLIGPLQARVLIAAERCQVLATLGKGACTSPSLAAALALDEECLSLLLRVLQAMGYVERAGALWRLTQAGSRYFGPHAEEPYSDFVAFGEAQWQMMSALDQVLRTGLGVDFHAQRDEATWHIYQRAMLENAQSFAWFVAEHVPVPRGATRCLDIAGAHGRIGAELCRRHPGLRSTVLDLPEAIASAQELAAHSDYRDLVSFQAWDLRVDDFPAEQDVILLCNILHHFSDGMNLSILQRARRALKPGGTIAVFDVETPPEDAPADAAGDGLALYFRVTSNSRCVRGEEYARWLEECGFHTHIIRSLKLPARVLIVGKVP